jgi:ATP-binding cassette, subfamily B (MDR/TAP), member 1
MQTLYAGTVRFNILLGAIKPHSEVTQEEIETACRSANILDFIRSLPEFVILVVCGYWKMLIFISLIRGFDTEVGGKGSQLSGGQKRIYFQSKHRKSMTDSTAYRTNRYRACTSS